MDNRADIQNIKGEILNKSPFAFAFLSIAILGTSLNWTMGFSEMLRQDNLSQKDRVLYTDFIINNGQQFLSVLDSVITLADIEVGDNEAEYTDSILPQLMNELKETYTHNARAKGICIVSQIPENNSLEIYRLDRKKLEIVFSSLIENAIKRSSFTFSLPL